MSKPLDGSLLQTLRARAGERDRTGTFPREEWDALVAHGATRWAVPASFGGEGMDPVELHERYEALARASLAVAFILTQHDGAIGYLAASSHPFDVVLRRAMSGEGVASVAISHLTTSRGGGVRAREDGDDFVLNGLAPWCTAADAADDLAVAATTEEGEQVLCLVRPKEDAGVELPPPPRIVALSATRTGPLRLTNVRAAPIAGPTQGVLGQRVGKLPIGQAFLALGHVRGALDLIREEASSVATNAAEQLEAQLDGLRRRVLRHVRGEEGDDGDALRGESIALAQQACLSAVTVHKGAALVNDHPAQRLAREALFLLVWSCPEGVRDCTLAELTCEGGA